VAQRQITKEIRKYFELWLGCSLVVEHWPSIQEALGSNHSAAKSNEILTAWEDVDHKVSEAALSTPTDNPGPDQHSPLDRPTPTQGKKKLNNKQ
jgi:hypothetical protein